jgi:hypothetical protein
MTETVLLATLDEYMKLLQTHLAALRERHQDLETAWLRLRDVYQGEGAEIFGQAFETASARLADYGTQGALISRQLQNKIEDLRAFEAAGSGL